MRISPYGGDRECVYFRENGDEACRTKMRTDGENDMSSEVRPLPLKVVMVPLVLLAGGLTVGSVVFLWEFLKKLVEKFRNSVEWQSCVLQGSTITCSLVIWHNQECKKFKNRLF